MMHHFLKSISYIFHPLLMPILGIIFYFSKTPRYIPLPIIKAKLVSIFILTVVLPVLLYYLLKTLKKVDSINLETPKERIIPLALNTIIIVLVLQRILPQNEVIELYYYFLGILLSTIACLILAVLKFKASIHMIAVGGVFMFFIALSIHFSININGTIALLFVLIGAVASSRLYLKAHDSIELLIGFFVGLFPQLILLNYWLQ